MYLFPPTLVQKDHEFAMVGEGSMYSSTLFVRMWRKTPETGRILSDSGLMFIQFALSLTCTFRNLTTQNNYKETLSFLIHNLHTLSQFTSYGVYVCKSCKLHQQHRTDIELILNC